MATVSTSPTTPQHAHDLVEHGARTPDRDIRFVREIAVGEHVRQGDVYLIRLAKRPDAYATPTAQRQLTPGTTKGSRHVAEGASLKLFTTDERSARRALARLPGVKSDTLLTGPVIEADERFTVSHPEHAHHSLPAGTYAVLYQLDPRSMRRVED